MNHLPLLVRREFWEHRAFVIAPAVVAVIVLLGAVFGEADFGDVQVRLLERPDLMSKQVAIVGAILSALALPYLIVMGCVMVFYLLDCLHADRKDRSVLFWKSLPVSDGSTVLAKLATAALALPLLTFGAILATNLLFALIESVRFSIGGQDLWSFIWEPRAWFAAHALLLYGLVVVILWYLPIIAWLLLVSAWARRAVILWAVLPPLMLLFLDRMTFNSGYFARLLRERLFGWFDLAMNRAASGEHSMIIEGERIPWSTRLADILDPASFFSSPQLWLGLVAAALLVWAAIIARRHRTEI